MTRKQILELEKREQARSDRIRKDLEDRIAAKKQFPEQDKLVNIAERRLAEAHK